MEKLRHWQEVKALGPQSGWLVYYSDWTPAQRQALLRVELDQEMEVALRKANWPV